MTTLGTAVDALQLLGEPTRVRLLSLLASDELTVAELVAVTRLAQSTISTHLGRLREAGLVRDRKSGASTFYAINEASMPASARNVWRVVREDVKDALLDDDRARATKVVRARDRAAGWPDAVAGEMDRHWSPGRTWESLARAMAGLVALGDVVDVGSGDGAVAQLLAPRSRSYTCVDQSARLLDAARSRLGTLEGVRLVQGDAQSLPLDDGTCDAVLLLHVLAQVERPARALAEGARVLRPGGRAVVVTLDAHAHADVTAAYGDVHAGFAPATLRRQLVRAGFEVESCEITSRDARPPSFRVVTAFATKRKIS